MNGLLKTPDRKQATGLLASPRLRRIREALLETRYHICIQKAALMTEYFQKNAAPPRRVRWIQRLHWFFYRRSLKLTARDVPQKSWQIKLNSALNAWNLRKEGRTPGETQIEYARALRYILENMDLSIYPDELIFGNPSSYRIGAPLHPELGGVLLYPELKGLATRKQNPLEIEAEERSRLEKEIMPAWFYRSVFALTPLYHPDPELFNTLLAGDRFILTQFSGIAHLTPDYESVIRKGFRGIKTDIESRLADLTGADEETRERRRFYEASLIVTEAAIDYGRRWRGFLESQAGRESDQDRRGELLQAARVFARVPEHPAASFREALQSMFTAHVIVHQESFQHGVSFGRLDQVLYPYYRRDLEAGALTRDEAGELIGCFLAKASELLPLFFDKATEYFSGLSSASGITLGGIDAEGRPAENDLSFLILEAYDQLRLRQPNFHVRVAPGTSSDFLHACFEAVKKGGGMPAFFNDRKISPALARAGFAANDARNYSIVGCSEWGVPNRSFPAAGAAFLNMALALDLALHPDREARNREEGGGSPGEIRNMEDVQIAFRKQLAGLVRTAVSGNNSIETVHALHRPTPFLSVIVAGCIENGREINAGGATYNSSGIQGVGLADVVDSLVALENLVFKEKVLSLEEFVDAVDRNFAGREDLRSRILNKLPKYGEDAPAVEYYTDFVSSLFAAEVLAQPHYRGGKNLPGFWNMTTHQGFGHRTGALPGGRRAGEPLANGVSPRSGHERRGPTAAMNSAACVPFAAVANGYVLNQKLGPDLVRGARGNQIMEGLLRGYFRRGGMQVQFNILDPELLLQAKRHPERFRDLVVRISGYSAYFNDLTESMQDEIIERTMHCAC